MAPRDTLRVCRLPHDTRNRRRIRKIFSAPRHRPVGVDEGVVGIVEVVQGRLAQGDAIGGRQAVRTIAGVMVR
ncbi:MAG: hypothetical protein OXC10_13640 [Rhodospirillaceae bacterium]|nr:hypothetical protein [Rhodospirillaceae bacterium]